MTPILHNPTWADYWGTVASHVAAIGLCFIGCSVLLFLVSVVLSYLNK